MNAVIFGASGRVEQGVLLECLRDTGVEHVLEAKDIHAAATRKR